MHKQTGCSITGSDVSVDWRVLAKEVLDYELGELRRSVVGQDAKEVAHRLVGELEARSLLARGAQRGDADFPVLALSCLEGSMPGEDLARQVIEETQHWLARVVALEQAGLRAQHSIENAQAACQAVRAIESVRQLSRQWRTACSHFMSG